MEPAPQDDTWVALSHPDATITPTQRLRRCDHDQQGREERSGLGGSETPVLERGRSSRINAWKWTAPRRWNLATFALPSCAPRRIFSEYSFGMASDRTARRIEEASRDGRLVTVVRRKSWDRLNGSIVRLGTKWLLMAIELNAGFNGHALIRKSDVRNVRSYPTAGFVQRALVTEGHWPLPGLNGIELTTTQSVLRSAARVAPLIRVFYEQEDPDDCRIGLPHDFKRRRFKLKLVTTAAEWDADTVFDYRSVSRIDLGGAYERRLAAVSGAAPDAR